MAIRPTDIQGSIWQASQTAPLTQRAEEAPRTAQAAAQAAFAAQVETRQETVTEAVKVAGDQIDPNTQRRREGGERRERKPRTPFEETVDEAAGLEESAHLVDFTA